MRKALFRVYAGELADPLVVMSKLQEHVFSVIPHGQSAVDSGGVVFLFNVGEVDPKVVGEAIETFQRSIGPTSWHEKCPKVTCYIVADNRNVWHGEYNELGAGSVTLVPIVQAFQFKVSAEQDAKWEGTVVKPTVHEVSTGVSREFVYLIVLLGAALVYAATQGWFF